MVEQSKLRVDINTTPAKVKQKKKNTLQSNLLQTHFDGGEHAIKHPPLDGKVMFW